MKKNASAFGGVGYNTDYGNINLYGGYFFDNGSEYSEGGVFYNYGNLHIIGGYFKDNKASIGTAIYDFGWLSIDGGTLLNDKTENLIVVN